MNEQTLTDTQIKAAFLARSEGSISPDLADRIRAETSRTRQASRLTVLPGGLGDNPNIGRLLLAAAISATSLALVGGLLLAGRQPDDQAVVPPSETPVATPSVAPEPSENPSELPAPSEPVEPVPAEPTPAPTPTPANFDPYPFINVDSAAITLVGDLRVRSRPTVDESSAKLEPLLPSGMRLLVIGAPVEADGYAWYPVMPFDSGYPNGWVAAGSRDGEAWIGADQPSCPEAPIDIDEFGALGLYGGLVCFGSEPIDVTGDIECSLGDVDNTIRGPSWITDDHVCFLNAEDGTPAFGINDGGMVIGYPMVEPAHAVTGHFGDPESASCFWDFDPPGPEPMFVQAMCRTMFVGTDLR